MCSSSNIAIKLEAVLIQGNHMPNFMDGRGVKDKACGPYLTHGVTSFGLQCWPHMGPVQDPPTSWLQCWWYPLWMVWYCVAQHACSGQPVHELYLVPVLAGTGQTLIVVQVLEQTLCTAQSKRARVGSRFST